MKQNLFSFSKGRGLQFIAASWDRLINISLVVFPLLIFFTQQNFTDVVMVIWGISFLMYILNNKNKTAIIDLKLLFLFIITIFFFLIHLLSMIIYGIGNWYHGYYFRLIMIVPTYYLFRNNKISIKNVNYVLMLTLGFSLGVGILQVFILKYQRAGVPFMLNHSYYPINWGDTLLMSGVYLACYGIYFKPKNLNLYLFSGFSGLLCSLLSGSRGGLLGLPLVIIALILNLMKNFIWRIIFISCTLLGLILLLGIAYKYNFLRVATGYNDLYSCFVLHNCINYANGGDNSLGLRIMMWKNAWALFTKYPLFGAGIGGYTPGIKYLAQAGIIPHYFQWHYNEEPHNEIIRILAMFGMIGLATYFTFLGYLLFMVRKNHNSMMLMCAVMIIFFCSSLSQALLIAPIACDTIIYLIALVLYGKFLSDRTKS